MKYKNEIPVMYGTDNINQAKLVDSKADNISVVYHNPNIKISPVLTIKTNGRSYTKWNPKYVEFLKKNNPGISEVKILKYMRLAIEQLNRQNFVETDKNEIHQNIKRR